MYRSWYLCVNILCIGIVGNAKLNYSTRNINGYMSTNDYCVIRREV